MKILESLPRASLWFKEKVNKIQVKNKYCPRKIRSYQAIAKP